MVSSMDHAMLAMVRLLGRSLHRDAVAQAIAEAAAQLPTADAAAMHQLNTETSSMVVEAGWGLAPDQQPLPVERALAGRALTQGVLVTSDNLAAEQDLRTPGPVAGGHFAAAIAAPLPDENDVHRAISIYRLSPGPFPAGTAEFMTMLAAAAAAALHNARTFDREERSRKEQEAINQAALAMSSELSLDRLLQLIVTLARDLAGARYAALGVPGPDGRLVQFITAGMSAEQQEQIGRLPEGHGLLGALLKGPHVIRLRRMQDDARAQGFPPHHPPMTSLLGVPILFRGRNTGDIYLTDKLDAPEFSVDDERIVVMLAAHASVAIANATSYGETNEQLQQQLAELAEKNRELQRLTNGILAAQEDERHRIARELHDDTMQALAALVVQARLAGRRQDVAGLRAGLDQVREGIGQTLVELRRLAYDLRPTALDELGLTAALAGLANDFAERTGVRIEPHLVAPSARLPGPYEIVLYRVAQEALSNVAKHAKATAARLELAVTAATIRLVVADNGCGFLPDQQRQSRENGLGLLGMAERVQALHGRLSIDSAAGSGTRVAVDLPVVADTDRRQAPPERS